VLDIPAHNSDTKDITTNKLTPSEVTKLEDKIKRLSDASDNLDKKITDISEKLQHIKNFPDKYQKYNTQ